MSRTLGSILTIAGSAALVATGVGAAAGLALFGTTAGVGFGTSIGLGTLLTASTVLTAVGTGLTAAAGQKAPKAETSEQALKTARPPRISGYGRARLPGAWRLYP